MAKEPKDQGTPSAATASGSSSAVDVSLIDLIRRLSEAGGVPITVSHALAPVINTVDRLRRKPRRTVAFPPCADELLALIKTAGKDDISKFFRDYFKFRRHHILGQYLKEGSPDPQELEQHLPEALDPDLLNCPGDIILEAHAASARYRWPTECCLCPPCVTLDGERNHQKVASVPNGIRRLFVGDVLWLFYLDRLGIHQILGVILDAFASNGRLPISSGSIDTLQINNDIVALVLEVMVRQTKMGLSSSVRDRASTYRTSMGWDSKLGRGLGLDTEVNTGFNTLFHQFIFNALEFYKDKRLAVAIRGTTAPEAPPSVATLITLSNTIDVLKKRFEAFDYGRNYYNTLAGIVWTIAGMSVIRELRTTLGIPPAYEQAHEFIPAAYDLLVLKRPVTHGTVNPYMEHVRCAENGRDILLDLEVINHTQNGPTQELENWLAQIEPKVEAYRTAYRNLTGVDLGAAAGATIEQQVPA